MKPAETYEIGPHSQIDEQVILGYTYPGWSSKLIVGSNAIIRCRSILYVGTTIGKRFTCGHDVLIRAGCTIGDRVVVLHKSSLEGNLRIGSGVKIMAHVYIPSRTIIEDMVFVGPGVTFLNHKMPMRSERAIAGPVVEANVAIGGGAIICPEVRIGRNSFIGAGTLVNRDVPPDSLAYGVPARHQPLPPALRGGNWPEQMMSGTDLFAGQTGDVWRADYPDLPGRPEEYQL